MLLLGVLKKLLSTSDNKRGHSLLVIITSMFFKHSLFFVDKEFVILILNYLHHKIYRQPMFQRKYFFI